MDREPIEAFIAVKQLPEGCIDCVYCKDYMCHAMGEYWPKYTAHMADRPDWCPIEEVNRGK